ncbi:MAG: hypothetical protein WAM14_06865, partial [Candidatus Nitrosopolaris sp.]
MIKFLENNYTLIVILSMILAIMVSGLTGVFVSRYAYAHYLPVTQTSAAPPSSNTTSISAPPSSNTTSISA